MKRVIGVLVLGMVLGLCVYAEGSVPHLMNYQGRLTNASGAAVSDGNYAIQMSIYESATGGTAIWQEIQTIFINNGIFNLMLGSSTPINLPFNKDYWLGTKVGADSEMTPRQQLVSGAYSFRADQAGTATLAMDSQKLTGKLPSQLEVGTASYAHYAGTATYAETAGAAPGTATYAIQAGTANYSLNADKLTGKLPSELSVGTATYSTNAGNLTGTSYPALTVGTSAFANTATYAADSQKLTGKLPSELTVGTASVSIKAQDADKLTGKTPSELTVGTATYSLNADKLNGKEPIQLEVGTALWQ
ncbi:MAG: hypothetical protein ABH870_01905 [bacterium]